VGTFRAESQPLPLELNVLQMCDYMHIIQDLEEVVGNIHHLIPYLDLVSTTSKDGFTFISLKAHPGAGEQGRPAALDLRGLGRCEGLGMCEGPGRRGLRKLP
jgi:hypothetical protein